MYCEFFFGGNELERKIFNAKNFQGAAGGSSPLNNEK
jgi:hypothetical protein